MKDKDRSNYIKEALVAVGIPGSFFAAPILGVAAVCVSIELNRGDDPSSTVTVECPSPMITEIPATIHDANVSLPTPTDMPSLDPENP